MAKGGWQVSGSLDISRWESFDLTDARVLTSVHCIRTKVHFENNTSSLLQSLLIVVTTMLRVFPFYFQVSIWYSSLSSFVSELCFGKPVCLLFFPALAPYLSTSGRLLREMGLPHLPMARSWNEPVTLDHTRSSFTGFSLCSPCTL